ncbi:MAG: restriction endonuclease subunit S [Lachnospiraceae bacterium]
MSKKKNMYKLESLARLISGRTPEREQKEYYAETGTPWVKIENLDQGYIRETAEYLSEQGKEKVNLVPENSVLFSIVGTVGKVGIAGRELATNQQIVSLILMRPGCCHCTDIMHSGIMRKRSANCPIRPRWR